MSDLSVDTLKQVHKWGQDSHGEIGYVEGTEGRLALVSSACKEVDLEKYYAKPLRTREHQTFTDAASFCAYVNRFATDASQVFYHHRKDVECVLDYHQPDGTASWCEHHAYLSFVQDRQFTKWFATQDKLMSQEAFAEFLEDMQWTITDPDAASLQESISKFQVTSSFKFERSVNAQTGGLSLVYKDDKQVSGQIKPPTTLGIYVPVFVGGEPVQLVASVRWRLQDSTLRFFYKIQDIDKRIDEAYEAIVADIEKQIPTVSVYRCP